MSKTPRTEKATMYDAEDECKWVTADFARQLETELNEANEKNKKLIDELVATKSLLKMLTK